MNKTEEIFLQVIKCAINGEKIDNNINLSEEEWQSLFILAEKHSLLPMFFEAVYSLPQVKKLDAPFVFASKKKVMNQVLMQTIRTGEFLNLYKELIKNEIKPVVVNFSMLFLR